eukprot:4727174-Amphidinium_carterae.1
MEARFVVISDGDRLASCARDFLNDLNNPTKGQHFQIFTLSNANFGMMSVASCGESGRLTSARSLMAETHLHASSAALVSV